MIFRKSITLLFGMVCTALLSCNSKLDSAGSETITSQQLTSFQSLKTEILDVKCATCHNSSRADGGVNLSSYENILGIPELVVANHPEASLLYTEVANGSMPKNQPPLSPREISAIEDWILAGAPQGDFGSGPQAPNVPPAPPTPLPTPPPPAEPPPATLSYSDVQIKIFNKSCVRCHTGSRPSGNVDLTNYQMLMANTRPRVVEPGNPAKSLVYTEIANGSMPPRGTKVDPALTKMLFRWIQSGAHND